MALNTTYDDKTKVLRVQSHRSTEVRKADFIGESLGIRFYEDPFYGDETGLWAVFRGRVAPTDYFEVPDADEIDNASDFFECYAS